MNNYHYIIGSLPELFNQWTLGDTSPRALIQEIRDLCCNKDKDAIDFLCDGLKGEILSSEFYKKAEESPCRFIRDYFSFDLAVRNAKVRYLNRALGRDKERDVISIVEAGYIPAAYIPEKEFEDEAKLKEILSQPDILEREKAMDRLYWDKIEAMTVLENFSIEAIMAFIAKLKIIDRWHKLDENTGRKMFRELASQVTATYNKNKTI